MVNFQVPIFTPKDDKSTRILVSNQKALWHVHYGQLAGSENMKNEMCNPPLAS